MTNRSRVLCIIVVALLPFVARWAHQEFRAPSGTREGYAGYLLLALICVLVVATMEAPPRTSSITRVVVSSTATALVALGAAATSQVFFPATLPRFVILLTTVLVLIWLLMFGSVATVRLRRAGGSNRVVAVINPADAAQLEQDVDDGPFEQRFILVTTITTENEYAELSSRCRAAAATTLVLGQTASVHPEVIDQAEVLHREGVRVRSLDDFYDESLGKLPLSALDRFALMGDIETVHGAYAPLKRAIDIVLAALGSLVLIALAPLVMIGNAFGNRGPLFFRQDRVGLNGKPFSIWKFRTMKPGAVDVSGWTSNEDPRITPFGKVLRRIHVDELPQVVNIFVGDLSVVGPRPEQVGYARQLERQLPFYSARHLVRPGLTGWAQVKYRYAASEEDAYIKLQFDLHYLRHESLATDLRIIWLTVRHLILDGGR
jgi:lipopolysaccharide/colanic/teichoic acid biosynthesis glycosyltransferase